MKISCQLLFNYLFAEHCGWSLGFGYLSYAANYLHYLAHRNQEGCFQFLTCKKQWGNVRSQTPMLLAKVETTVLGHFVLKCHLLTEEHTVRTMAVDILI